MTIKPIITTIIPTYQRSERLKKAIRSVLNQTYPHFQICVYDNASHDATAAVMEELMKEDARIQYHCHLNDIGAAANFQYGLSHIETPFFSFLSDDDFLLPEFYETTLNGFEKHPDAAFSAGAVIDMNEKREVVDVILSKWPDKEYYAPPDGLLEMIGKYSNWVGVLFRKELIAKIGPLDLNLKAIDVDYMFRAASCLPFVISKKPCAVFVQHSASYSGSHGFKLIWPGWQIMISKLKESAQLSPDVKTIAMQKLQIDLQRLLLMNALRSLEKKQFDEAAAIADVFYQNDNKRIEKRVLAIGIKICQALPFAQKLLVMLLKIRRFWLRRINMAHIQPRDEI